MADLSLLRRLLDGWDGPGSKAIPAVVFANYDTLVAEFDSQVPADLEPMARGNGAIRLEWERDCLSFTVELLPEGGMWLCRLSFMFDGRTTDRFFESFDAETVKRFYETGRISRTGTTLTETTRRCCGTTSGGRSMSASGYCTGTRTPRSSSVAGNCMSGWTRMTWRRCL